MADRWQVPVLAGVIAVLLALPAAVGCGGEDAYDYHFPYGGYSLRTVWQYSAVGLDGTAGSYTLAFHGEETLDGVPYTKLTLERPGRSWDILVTPAPINLAEGPFTIGAVDSTSGFTLHSATPLVVDADPPVGVPVPVNYEITGYSPLTSMDYAATLTGTYTLVDTNASATTPLGTIRGCRHYSGEGSITGTGVPSILAGVPVTAELWYHESYGLVKYSIPELGLSGDLTGTWDDGDEAGGFNTIRKMGVIDGPVREFRLDTYDVHGRLDADKRTHAKMLLELRWLDEERARTGPMPSYPAVIIEFGTASGGVFFADLVESPVSIFHPEENGNGFKYWIAFVDEAARNEPGDNGIAYHVRVTADTDITPALRATARIYYKLYLP